MVGTSSSTETNNTPSIKRKPSKRVIIGAAVCVIILCGAGVWYCVGVGQSPKKQQSTFVDLCEGDAATRAQKAIMSGDSTALIAQSQEIRESEGYESNASCVYVVAEADVVLGDAEGAKKHQEVLARLLSGGQKLNSAFERSEVQIEMLRENINFISRDGVVQTEVESGAIPEGVDATGRSGDE